MAKGSSKQTDHLSIWGNAEYNIQNTTNKRYEYDRYQLMAGVKLDY